MRTGCRIGGSVIVALILLRLALSWHFLSAGIEKFRDPHFSAEPFLLQAVGPAADLFHQQVPGFHRWRELLATPRQDMPLSDEERQQLDAWNKDLQERFAEIKKGNQKNDANKKDLPLPVRLPPVAAYQPWGDEIVQDWGAMLAQFKTAAKLSEDQQEQAAGILRQRTRRLADYLSEQEADIIKYRHELHRLHQFDSSPAANELPYLDERIAAKKAETRGMTGVWIADIREMEQVYTDKLRGLLPEDATDARKANAAKSLAGNQWPNTVSLIVTWMTFGVGALLLVGLFTRLAAFVGAMFILSVLVSQPPWVAGAEQMFLPYQLVEFTALILLIATAAGRYGGLDFFIHSCLSKCCGSKCQDGKE